ncbi:MAG: diguanylate cyclase [Polyangiaceae bacterium]|nr:diguanylate cyclase [Polyangiaceae bacterium]
MIAAAKKCPTRRATPVSVAATQIVQAALREDVSVAELGKLAAADPIFALRVLAFVNSPLMGLRRRVDDVVQAASLLGLRGLRNIALSLVVAGFAGRSPGATLLLANCVRRAIAARHIGRALRGVDADLLFTTGLFLDVGLLVAPGDQIELAQQIGASPATWRVTRERAAGLLPHPQRGADLARDYGLADNITEALLHHHDADPPSERSMAAAWLAERCAGVFEGGDLEYHRARALQGGQRLGLDAKTVEGVLGSLPQEVAAFGTMLDQDMGEQLDLEALRSRAREELVQLNAQYESLVRALEDTIANQERLEQELRRANDRLERLASTDELTSVLNRRALEEALRRDLARADRDAKPLSVALLDVDHFKAVNDTWGHQTGDAVLAMVGRSLKDSLRVSDVIGRYGGEEFLCILPATDSGGALVVAERLRRVLCEQAVPTPAGTVHVTASFGVATATGPGCRNALSSIVSRADACLYRAKQGGRNRVVVDDEQSQASPTPDKPQPAA